MTAGIKFGELFAVPLRNGVSYPSRQRGSGVPMVNMKEIFAFDRISNQECELAPITENERASCLLESWDLLFARQSLTYEGAGKCSLVLPFDGERTFESHLMRVRLSPEIASAAFYYYYFRSASGRRNIETIVQQVAAAGIRGSDLARLTVPFPPISEQGAIAEVLGALDDKIAANTQLAATSMRLAETYFNRTMRLATDERALGEILSLEYGKSLPTSSRVTGPIDVYGSGGITGSHNEALCPDPGVVVGRKGTAGAVHWSHRPFFPIDTTYYVVPSHHAVSQVFCYFLLRTLGLNEMNNDSAVPGLNRNQAHASRIMLPCEAALNEFTSLATKLFSTAAQVERENSTLVLTRNALLPQLMSGKLRVKDAGKVLENAGV